MTAQEQLLHNLNQGVNVFPICRKTFADDHPGSSFSDEEAFHYTLIKYKIGLIRDRSNNVLKYYIYEQQNVEAPDSREPETQQHSTVESESAGGGNSSEETSQQE